MGVGKPQPLISLPEPSGERLDSWKEIAAYLKRDQRTVRRWEKEGLPVRRKVHKKQASVFAYRAEIDAWWHDGRQRLEQKEQAGSRKRLMLWGIAGAVAVGLVILAALNVGGLRHGPWHFCSADHSIACRAAAGELIGRPRAGILRGWHDG